MPDVLVLTAVQQLRHSVVHSLIAQSNQSDLHIPTVIHDATELMQYILSEDVAAAEPCPAETAVAAADTDGVALTMKYFVLNPSNNGWHGGASRAALLSYVSYMALHNINPIMRKQLRDWAYNATPGVNHVS